MGATLLARGCPGHKDTANLIVRRLCVSALTGLGGLDTLAGIVVDRHAELRRLASAAQTAMPPTLQEPLTLAVAAVAVLRRAANSTLQNLQFAAPDGGQDGALRAVVPMPEASNVADAVIDQEALELLRSQRCVVKTNFLCSADAAKLHNEFVALADEGRVFERSRSALVNNASGREFFNLSADEARRRGAPTVARTLDALDGIAHRLSATSSSGGASSSRPRPWWGEHVLAPSRATIQRYPVGASYAEHTDTHYLGSGWVGPRAFTALVYAHRGWSEGHGGELTVRPPAYAPGTAAVMQGEPGGGVTAAGFAAGEAVVVEPRGGTLAIFPSHLIHEVAPVAGCERFAVTVWLSLQERVASDETRSVAARLSSTEWVGMCADYARVSNVGGAGGANLPPGTIVANAVLDHAQRAAGHTALLQ